jgi:hypothetical protein
LINSKNVIFCESSIKSFVEKVSWIKLKQI